jgi:hypothetical protein
MTITIFTKQGAIRDDFNDDERREIAALDPVRRLALDSLIEAAERNTATEAALKNVEQNLKSVLAKQAEAAREVERVTPKRSHHDLYLHMVKKIAPAAPTAEQLAAEAALDAATEALAVSRDDTDAARMAVKDSRAAFATALTAWQGGPVATRESLVREAAKNFKPTPAPRREYLTEIDRYAAASAGAIDARAHGQRFRRGPEGKRSFPAAMRGQTLPGYVKG